MEKTETAKRLRKLFEQVNDIELECRRIMLAQPSDERGDDWRWVRELRDCLYGSRDPSMLRIVRRLEDEAGIVNGWAA